MAVPSYDYQPPYAMPQLPKMGDPSVGTGAEGSYSPPYIGGPGDPNAGRIQSPATPNPIDRPNMSAAGGSNYGPYLGWDQQKLNDPTHNSSKYQFLRTMLDAGIDPSKFAEKDPSGINQIVAALNAKGIGAKAVPGSDDRLFWPGEGEFDAIDRSTTPGTPRFFFAQQSDVNGNPLAQGGAGSQGAAGMLPGSTSPGSLMQPMGGGSPDLGLGPWNSSSYSNPNSQQIANQAPGNMFNRQPYTPPYLNGAV